MGCAAALAILSRMAVLAARVGACAPHYKVCAEPAFRSEQALPAMGCAAAPAILIRMVILRPGANLYADFSTSVSATPPRRWLR